MPWSIIEGKVIWALDKIFTPAITGTITDNLLVSHFLAIHKKPSPLRRQIHEYFTHKFSHPM
jgi:hypothetical protein